MGLESQLTSNLGKRDSGTLPGVVSYQVPTHMVSSFWGHWEDEEIPCKNQPESLPPLYHVLLTLLVPAMPTLFPFLKHMELISPSELLHWRIPPLKTLATSHLPSGLGPQMTSQQFHTASCLVSIGSWFSIIWLTCILVYCLPLSTRI